MKKNQNGITLIALVITIIVLLILAGVSIALLTSDGNILENAGKAASETDIGTAKDLAGVRAAGYLNDYYEKKYANSSAEVTEDSAGEYVQAQFAAAEETALKAEGYTVSGDTITIEAKTTENKTVTGTISEKGIITWNEAS